MNIKHLKYNIKKYINDIIFVVSLNHFAHKRHQEVIFRSIWFSTKEQLDWWIKETDKSLNKRKKLDWKLYKVKI
jgi:hypothetical protein